MNNSTNKINTKYLKAGGYTLIVSLIAVVIFVAANLIINLFPATVTGIDMTSSDVTTLSEETTEYLKTVDDDVTIYYVGYNGEEDFNMKTIVEKIASYNSHISVQYIDPSVSPTFAKKYDIAFLNTLVVESANRFKTVSYYQVYYSEYSDTYDDQTLAYYQQQGQLPASTSFSAEAKICSAIEYVLANKLPKIYTLTGHGEIDIASSELETTITDNAFEISTLNLQVSGSVAEDCDCIFVIAPEHDIDETEKDILLNYLSNGGRLMLITSFENLEYPNLLSVMEAYGASAQKGWIVEGDSNKCYGQLKDYLIPTIKSHEITNKYTALNVIVPFAHGIVTNSENEKGATVTELLTTSSSSFAKNGEYVASNENYTQNYEKDDTCVDGPFNVGVAISAVNEGQKDTRICWYSTPYIMMSSDVDTKVFLSSFDWLCEKESGIIIASKTTAEENLTVTETQSTVLTAVFLFIIPIVTVGTGIVIVVRRNNAGGRKK